MKLPGAVNSRNHKQFDVWGAAQAYMLPKCLPHNYTHFGDFDRFLRSFMHEMIHSMATPFGILPEEGRKYLHFLIIELLQLGLNIAAHMTYAGYQIESTIQREIVAGRRGGHILNFHIKRFSNRRVHKVFKCFLCSFESLMMKSYFHARRNKNE